MPLAAKRRRVSDVPDLLRWSGGHGNRFTHDWFRFPGKFHPPLVEHILRSLKPNGVIDPMAGVGTVAIEAKAAGIPSLSLDIDPLSVFFTEVKTTPISEGTLSAAWKHLSGSLKDFRRDEKEIAVRKFRDIRTDAMRRHLAAAEAHDLERLAYWFRRYVIVDYARIDHAIFNGGLPNRSQPVRNFFLACLLSTVRRISLADPTPVSGLEITSHMLTRIERGYTIDVFREFERRVELAIRRVGDYSAYLKEQGTYNTPTHVELCDSADLMTLKPSTNFCADLVLFSPPYCNAIEYWRRHRLEYFLGGFLDEAGAVDLYRRSIGRTTIGRITGEQSPLGYAPIDSVFERLKKEKRVRKAHILSKYFEDMASRLNVFYRSLPQDGHCVVVVGDSTTGGRRIPTAKTLQWLGEQSGFDHLGTSRYRIKNRVMQFPVKNSVRIEHESIIVFRKN